VSNGVVGVVGVLGVVATLRVASYRHLQCSKILLSSSEMF